MKIISLNVRIWMRDCNKQSEHYWRDRYAAINTYLREQAADIVCLQEVWHPAAQLIMDGLDYRRLGAANLTHPIFVRNYLGASNHKTSIHWSRCDVGDLRIVNVHGRWDQGTTQRLISDVDEMVRPGRTIACGDWNVELGELGNLNALASARKCLGHDRVETFQNFTKSDSHGEIDHFMVNFAPASFAVGPEGLSDHRPIVMEF